MENNNKINTIYTTQKIQTIYPEKNSALKKLNAFNAKMSNSDFNNSYTRYSIELKLVDKALNELLQSDSKEIMEQLISRRKVLLATLKSYGLVYQKT